MSGLPEQRDELVLAVRRLRTAIVARDRAIAQALRLREGDLSVLEVLHREGPQSPTVLAKRTGTRAATMTGVLVRLEGAGWIGRRPDAEDRRSVRIFATSVERFSMLYAADMDRLDALFRGWDADSAQAFLRSAREIAEALEGGARPVRGTAAHPENTEGSLGTTN